MASRLAYDDAASPQQMAHDGRVTTRRLRLLEQAARLATRPAPSLTYDAATPRDRKPGREIDVDAAAVRLAELYGD